MAVPKWSGLIFVWLVLAGILIVEATVRFALGYELGRVLFFEATLFIFAAALLNSIARRGAELSRRARTAIHVLSVAFVLGAIRAALWFAGLEVHWANLVILVIGLTLFTMWWRRRGSS